MESALRTAAVLVEASIDEAYRLMEPAVHDAVRAMYGRPAEAASHTVADAPVAEAIA